MSIPISQRLGSGLSNITRRPKRTLGFLDNFGTGQSTGSRIRLVGFRSTFRAASYRTVPRAPPIRRRIRPLPVLAAGSGLLTILFSALQPVTNEPLENLQDGDLPPPDSIPNDSDGLPRYRLAEVKAHGPKSERPWVICEDKVYDITDWIPGHPGGEVILRAAGGSIEPYWDIFSIHKSPYVKEILEQYIVGKVHPDDLENGRPLQEHIEDPFMLDPVRDTRLKQLTAKPCNAETPNQELTKSFLTPNPVFYVRNHMWVPVVEDAEAEEHNITIELPDGDIKTYSIKDLKARFKQHTVTAVLQCSGNRRSDMTRYAKKTNGLQWTVGAISCAKWEGVRLRDVLADAGLSLEDPGEDARHIQFSGLEAYGASIPISTVLDPMGDVLLAFKMNDEPLPRDHGFPVRVVVPGHVAARCVKWVNKIVVSDEESTTTWQRRDYKCFGPNEVKQDWDKYKAIQVMPITSAITRTRVQPADKTSGGQASESTQNSVVQIEGYAYSGGGREIQRVDISLDGGLTWDQAQLVDDTNLERGNKAWCWKRWRYETGLSEMVKGSKGESKATLVVKATDDAYNTQPETHKSIYNPRGNLATAWHRVDFDYTAALKACSQDKNKP
ncbi:Oxidoreductase, molybdopterin-binding domain-containing protein [Annulohypoxylon truncatum]|uniref:Oxidoreductase, molybdopterin-binding domain-containing protein n=1 Tax=Annulohypoxylon truncatum TaxID=327061 RepID=UPI00200754AB|nr:Oxidoreductase, molybdopterin-binding domain-containing protein [Annulohypoxylon truncatum]KAI1206971.1 Oxidoreductase, molybdopterin-binding domain-containing protein [Annulohypoxylon truncatum]